MMAAFANLTEAQRERLEMLAEEAAEVIQAVTKILRHGYQSFNPDAPTDGTNGEQLVRELVQLTAIAAEMDTRRDIDFGTSWASSDQVWPRKLRYTHHQGQPANASPTPEGVLSPSDRLARRMGGRFVPRDRVHLAEPGKLTKPADTHFMCDICGTGPWSLDWDPDHSPVLSTQSRQRASRVCPRCSGAD